MERLNLKDIFSKRKWLALLLIPCVALALTADRKTFHGDFVPKTTDNNSFGDSTHRWDAGWIRVLNGVSGVISPSNADLTLTGVSGNRDIVLDPEGTGGVRFTDMTASKVPYLDANKEIASSAVTPTELGYLSGVTSAIQTQLNALSGSVVSTTSSPLRIEGVRLNCDASSSIITPGSIFVTSIGDVSAGACAVNTGALFSSVNNEFCVAQLRNDANPGYVLSVTVSSTSLITVDCDDSSSAADCTAYDFDLICFGAD